MSFGELGDKAASVWRPLWLTEGRVTAAEVRPPPPNFPKVSKTKQRRDGDGFKMAVVHRKRSAMCEGVRKAPKEDYSLSPVSEAKIRSSY
jgi:hypothetical protein